MARVTALVPDLLFGSKLVEQLGAAGHEVDLVSSPTETWDEIAGTDVLVVDLATEELDAAQLVDSLRTGGEMGGTKTLGFFSHADTETRERAQAAGFDLVVPRSRMAREGADLVTRLAAGD